MHPLQEKFQIIGPEKKEPDEGWLWNGRHSGTGKYAPNWMPSVDLKTDNQMPLSLAGATDVTDCLGVKALDEGFTKHGMNGCDDQYTGEHIDHFYGDAGGFVERNNYLDRL